MASDETIPPEPRGRVLSIAGSDPSGGAGIQADLKTIAALGGYGATAITALTVQNTRGVTATHHVPADIIAGQIEAVLSDIGADAIKTGMLATSSVIETVADTLGDRVAKIPLVIDPVMVASSGAVLVEEDALQAMKSVLVPRAFMLTPNAPEAEKLTGIVVEDVDSQRAAGEALLEMGATHVLVKGGHIEGSQIIDLLVTPKGVRLFTRPRIRTRNTHGTGCTLASAIAAFLARGLPVDQSVEKAGDYLHEAIARAPGFGEGPGPVNHVWPLAEAGLARLGG
ncbi:bifunctional hydroxymethylpyrimidine kinase/phosphomethylpyrimidine kinase [Marinicauda algicola]|uniref:hydroxymethylpyrimidine kinase n=1 Tax=Marinicauda algicola TaxID=2029849 RepID=A0A4V3RYH8_9PROT|nr:bifunctional hydroxymethylpyrimidine kinase/phosphomethylpyrimidine kinase [Marinicauda algicola]TGY90439.1 bifunctional hydroxymethylpyrimidine kinase/phosphomethylpyrimidine kinase [Marinicauda algicola]